MIVAGYPSAVPFELGVALPAEAQFRAVLRQVPVGSPASQRGAVLGSLSSEDDTIELALVEGLSVVTLLLSGELTRTWTVDSVITDVVRVDVSPPQHLGWKAIVPVSHPETKVWE